MKHRHQHRYRYVDTRNIQNIEGNTDVVSVLDIDTERVGHEHGKGLECPCFIGSIPVPLDLQL